MNTRKKKILALFALHSDWFNAQKDRSIHPYAKDHLWKVLETIRPYIHPPS